MNNTTATKFPRPVQHGHEYGIFENADRTTGFFRQEGGEPLQPLNLFKVMTPDEKTHFVLAESENGAMAQCLSIYGDERVKVLAKTMVVKIPFLVRGWGQSKF